MSFFIQRIPSAGFEVQAASIEAHALADDDEVRAFLAPAQFAQPRRPMARAADGVDGRKVALEQRIAHPFAVLRAMRLAEVAHRGAKLLRTHVLARRVDQVAHTRRGLDQRRDRGDHRGVDGKLSRRAARLLVARELVGAQRPAQRDARQVDDLVAETIVTGRQTLRQAGQRVDIVSPPDAQQDAAQAAVVGGHVDQATGISLEALRLDPAPRFCAERFQMRLERVRGQRDQLDRTAVAAQFGQSLHTIPKLRWRGGDGS